MIVKKCGGCDQLFEVEASHQADTLGNPTGFRSARIDLCPGCRAGAIERGSWLPEEAKEQPAAEPEDEEPRLRTEGADGAR